MVEKIIFKSDELQTEYIINCKKEYKKSLKTGDFKNTNIEIKKSIEILLKKYNIKEIETIINEEINDEKEKNNIITTVIISATISGITTIIAEQTTKKLQVISIIILIYTAYNIGKDLIKLNNKNFLIYYKKQIYEYEKKKKQETIEI